MKKLRKIIALIPLRSGSKSIPDKNVKEIAGKPLFFWSIKEAIQSNVFEELYVSSDCHEILAKVTNIFPSVKTILRPKELAADNTSTEEVIVHFQSEINISNNVLCLIQVTNPLVKKIDFQRAKEFFFTGEYDSMVTVVEDFSFFWDIDGTPLNYDPCKRPRRQEFSGTLKENGAFYFVKDEFFKKYDSRLCGKIGVFKMAEYTGVEIDEPHDWPIIQELLLKYSKTEKTDQIKAVVFDVDGVMTDSGIYYNETGEVGKKFNSRDAHGIMKLRQKGIQVGIITGENSAAVDRRMEKLKIESYKKGIVNKLPVLKDMASGWNVDLKNIAYMGDDDGDFDCLKVVGLSGCPKNAMDRIKNICKFQSKFNGGEGAVREFTEYIEQFINLK